MYSALNTTTEPPPAPRAPTAPGVCVCVFTAVCVCALLCVFTVCVHCCVCVCVHCCVCVCSLLCVCVCVCVCVFTAVCVCVKCRAQILSMGHHNWPYVTSLFLFYFY